MVAVEVEGCGFWEEAYLGILLDGDQHSLLEFDVLGCEKVQVRLSPFLFRLVFLDSVNLYKG